MGFGEQMTHLLALYCH